MCPEVTITRDSFFKGTQVGRTSFDFDVEDDPANPSKPVLISLLMKPGKAEVTCLPKTDHLFASYATRRLIEIHPIGLKD